MILDELYESEINFSISTDWDAGWNVKLGNEYSGFDEETTVRTFDEAAAWLADQAKKHYPESDFAKRVR